MKEKVLYIRCSPETLKRFKILVAKGDYPDYEAALTALLDAFGEPEFL